MTALDEQETTITVPRTGDVVFVWSSDLRHVRRLRKFCVSNPDSVAQVAGGDTWGDFRVSADFFFLFSAFRRKREMSEATRAVRVAALESARAARAVA